MSFGALSQPARRSMSRTFVKAIHTTAFTCLAGALLVALAFQAAWPAHVFWPAMLALAPMAAVLHLLDRSPTTFVSLLYLLVGGASVYAYSFTMATQLDGAMVSSSISVAMPKIALVLVGGSGWGAGAGLRWCTAGFVVAEAASSGAILQSGSGYSIDFTTGAAYVTTALLLVLTYIGQRRTRPTQSLLHRATQDELVSALQYRIELKAAALLHDTVLNHLAAIAASPPGSLNPLLKNQIESDLARLSGDEWLNDIPPSGDGSGSDLTGTPVSEAIREVRALGLDVDATGDQNAVTDLDCERFQALGLALKECLVNVLRHSGATDAEVAVHRSENELLVMVIDTGSGFSESAGGSNRLGLKTSVRQRIEEVGGTVRIWSTPGRGTSVVLRLPIEQETSSPAATARDGAS